MSAAALIGQDCPLLAGAEPRGQAARWLLGADGRLAYLCGDCEYPSQTVLTCR